MPSTTKGHNQKVLFALLPHIESEFTFTLFEPIFRKDTLLFHAHCACFRLYNAFSTCTSCFYFFKKYILQVKENPHQTDTHAYNVEQTKNKIVLTISR